MAFTDKQVDSAATKVYESVFVNNLSSDHKKIIPDIVRLLAPTLDGLGSVTERRDFIRAVINRIVQKYSNEIKNTYIYVNSADDADEPKKFIDSWFADDITPVVSKIHEKYINKQYTKIDNRNANASGNFNILYNLFSNLYRAIANIANKVISFFWWGKKDTKNSLASINTEGKLGSLSKEEESPHKTQSSAVARGIDPKETAMKPEATHENPKEKHERKHKHITHKKTFFSGLVQKFPAANNASFVKIKDTDFEFALKDEQMRGVADAVLTTFKTRYALADKFAEALALNKPKNASDEIFKSRVNIAKNEKKSIENDFKKFRKIFEQSADKKELQNALLEYTKNPDFWLNRILDGHLGKVLSDKTREFISAEKASYEELRSIAGKYIKSNATQCKN